MSGWDEGGVYYSDQAHSWDDGRGESEAAAFDPDLPAKLRSAPADFLPLFETAATQVLVGLKTKVPGDTGVMEDATPGDVQIH